MLEILEGKIKKTVMTIGQGELPFTNNAYWDFSSLLISRPIVKSSRVKNNTKISQKKKRYIESHNPAKKMKYLY